ncbi:MAG: SMP-30/gluconolactonase/LRE family protein [Gammaproteobacteria bacterium]|nr:SMP-30/gluconolactonase/LRE family protein [Gammaproteobacteria bacterium]
MKIVFRVLATIVIVVLAMLIYALARSKVDPVVWTPGPNPGLTGQFAPNDAIGSATMLLQGVGVGPEDIAPGPDGWMYTGYRDGRIVRFNAEGRHEEFAVTGGFPLGMRVDSDNKLIVADADKGLLSISQNGDIHVLADKVDGVPMKFVEAVEIAADGTIWFTDASTRFTHHSGMYMFLEGRATGRLLSFSPDTEQVKIHLDDLAWANGVTVAPGDEFVLVAETSGTRVRRLWLKGDKAGTDDFFIDGLPGAPDNLSVDDRGTFWVGIAGIRDPAFEKLADKPFIRRLMGAMPISALTPDRSHAFILGLDGEGNVIHNLQQPQSVFGVTTGAMRLGDRLYITNLETDAVGVLELP